MFGNHSTKARIPKDLTSKVNTISKESDKDVDAGNKNRCDGSQSTE